MLLPTTTFLIVKFKQVTFKSVDGATPDVHVSIAGVELGDCLDFVKSLQSALPVLGNKGNGPFLDLIGDSIEVKIISVDRKNRVIGLSVKAKDIDDEKEAVRAHREQETEHNRDIARDHDAREPGRHLAERGKRHKHRERRVEHDLRP